MKSTLLLLLWQFATLASINAFADGVTLKDGRQFSGSIQSGRQFGNFIRHHLGMPGFCNHAQLVYTDWWRR